MLASAQEDESFQPSRPREPDLLDDVLVITNACDDDCGFCSQPRGVVPILSSDQVMKALELRARAGRKTVEFVGREPTLHPKLIDFVTAARRLGFRTIRVNSNGKRLADRRFTDRLLDAGVTECCISLHSPDAAQSDLITVRSGFDLRIAGISNVSRRIPVVLNFVIHDANFQQMPAFVEFVRTTFAGIRRPFASLRAIPGLAGRSWPSRSGVPLICFSFVELNPGLRLDPALLPRYTDAAPYLERALKAYRRADVHRTHTLPPCVAPRSIRRRVLARHVRPREGWVYLDACARCRLKPRCQGIPQPYLQRYGDSEFRPVS